MFNLFVFNSDKDKAWVINANKDWQYILGQRIFRMYCFCIFSTLTIQKA